MSTPKISLGSLFKLKRPTKSKRERFNPIGVKVQILRKETLDLQMELAMAIREGHQTITEKIIRTIYRSERCRSYALYLVLSRKGARSKGLDDLRRPETNDEYRDIIKRMWTANNYPQKYKASPLKRTMIPKPKGGLRPVSVPTYLDRALQTLYNFTLDVICEEIQGPNSFGFRRFRSPGWAQKAVTLAIWQRKTNGPPKYALECDIKGCFDNISHDYILNNVAHVSVNGLHLEVIPTPIMKQWLECGYVLTNETEFKIHPTTGVPQGGPISPTISNIVLADMENYVTEKIRKALIPLPKESPPDLLDVSRKSKYSKITFEPSSLEVFHSNKSLGVLHGVTETKPILDLMRTVQPDISSGTAIMLLRGKRKTRYNFSIKKISRSLENLEAITQTPNEAWCAMFRFADDNLILLNSLKAVDIALAATIEFLAPRGLELNMAKTFIRDIVGNNDPFMLCGWEFHIQQYLGQKKKKKSYSVRVVAPKKAIESVTNKIKNILSPNRTRFVSVFLQLNSILRGWSYFYCSGNTKGQMQYLNYYLWHHVQQYFSKVYSRNPKFKRSSQRLYKRKLVDFIKNRHNGKYATYSQWWKIPRDMTLAKKFDLWLFAPGAVEVQTPSIITLNPDTRHGLNAYHPDDRLLLMEKSMGWKVGLQNSILRKSKGRCALCSTSLLDNYEDSKCELHHVKPKALGGSFTKFNLKALCPECHKEVTTAVTSHNIEDILYYEEKKILSNISELLTPRSSKV